MFFIGYMIHGDGKPIPGEKGQVVFSVCDEKAMESSGPHIYIEKIINPKSKITSL